MKRRAFRRSRRMQRIFKYHDGFNGLKTTILAAVGVAAIGCTPESTPNNDTAGRQATADVSVPSTGGVQPQSAGRVATAGTVAGPSGPVAMSAGRDTSTAGADMSTAGETMSGGTPRGPGASNGGMIVGGRNVGEIMPGGHSAGSTSGGQDVSGVPASGEPENGPRFVCREGPGQSILDPNGALTGVERCQDGTKNRVEALASRAHRRRCCLR